MARKKFDEHNICFIKNATNRFHILKVQEEEDSYVQGTVQKDFNLWFFIKMSHKTHRLWIPRMYM